MDFFQVGGPACDKTDEMHRRNNAPIPWWGKYPWMRRWHPGMRILHEWGASYGLIDQLVYIEISKGKESESNRNMVCSLLKAFYGLKHSPRLWYEVRSTFFLEKLGLKRINADHSIFVTEAGLNGPILIIFVNDIKMIGPQESGMIERVKTELTFAFSMVDMGPICFYLGLKVERNRQENAIKLS